MQISTSEKILNAAEELFALSSYDAVSIRQITQKADVKLALAHYHFGTKDALFDAVIKRRIGLLSESRRQLLDYFSKENNGKPLSIEQIVHAFITPYLFWHLNGGAGWRSYARIVSTLLGYNLSLLQDQFDSSAVLFQQEMRRTLPNTDEASIQWGFDFMVGVMCNTFSEVDRIGGLSEQLCSVENKEQACEYLLSFIVAGLERLADNKKQDLSHTLSILTALNPTENLSE
ncbi:TetR/AcrR family transcriptional regulator [Pragia fontium]|uniref:Transcriptional regulator, TetR family n=2 Tax=Pragia fontium TaxID=82985 RepID=A0AAJ4WDQ9_9GAMM|nr:TetR/AcrR family transcriptional regulator [Pragia fontium]GKX64423.1 TetR family transcriptional regulator [Pragia fontium]SFD47390.1 transcriptional regulator, TetR family [Pragia fontium DSM 5563 = ATCC 49100]SUB83878.1 transcriptional repressor BetI [Pragia fontium]VEJ56784.1 transcriptional repressor BetI [Pragia fontium]